MSTTLSGVLAQPVKALPVLSGCWPVPVATTRAAWRLARLPAEECTDTPPAAMFSAVWAARPTWKSGSASKGMSSVMISAPLATRLLRAATWVATVLFVPSNRRPAPGAMSWTISSMAVPSSPFPASSTFTVLGRSPRAWDAARLVTPSEMTPMSNPVPSKPAVWATSARWKATPSLVTEPTSTLP